MNTTQEKILKPKLGLLELAKVNEIDNTSNFYRYCIFRLFCCPKFGTTK
ncbi:MULTISPECIES: hypothetical protein [unclassified Wolbachia]|nr:MULTISPECIES: hypothetical protein [unclassified Wolbachia]QUI60551.1 hypothetical protein JKF54_00845 [Wolbachia endosymbiont of Spodoptera picta]